MKKTLYSTTALAAAGLLTLGAGDAFAQAAAPAAPQKLKVELGGFHNQLIGFVDHSDKTENALGNEFRNFDQKSDSEIYFTGSVKLDNGITVSLMVQLETDEVTGTAGSNIAINSGTTTTLAPHTNYIDESYLRLTGDFGEVRLGTMDGASQALGVQAPGVGLLNISNTDISTWLNKPSGNSASTTCCGSTFGGGDAQRVYYITPSFAGFRAGGSYTPSNTNAGNIANAIPTNGGADNNGWTIDLAAQYADKIGDVGFRAYVGWWENGGATRPGVGSSASAAALGSFQQKNISVGADVTFGDITIGAGALKTDDRANSEVDNTANSNDKLAYNAGIAYKPGPWAASFTYQHVELSALSTDPDSDSVNRFVIGATYDIGPGVALGAQLIHQRYYDEADAANGEDKQYGLIGGIAVSF
jgi:outer membrane protein OmpU